MGDYEKWEKDCKKIKQQNAKLLEEFAEWLGKFGLVAKTINKHADNIGFYINHFLLYEDAIPAKDGSDMIGEYLGYWFIKKAMWANVSAVKQNISSFKKFYQFMMEKGEIKVSKLDELKQIIKNEKSEWIEIMRRYDDPDIEEMSEVWGI